MNPEPYTVSYQTLLADVTVAAHNLLPLLATLMQKLEPHLLRHLPSVTFKHFVIVVHDVLYLLQTLVQNQNLSYFLTKPNIT